MGGRGTGSNFLTPGGGGGGGKFSNGLGFLNYENLKEAIGPKGRPRSMADAMKNSNPHYSGAYADFSENCQRAVVAYEARRRGYDVTAQPTYQGDRLPHTAYVNPKTGVRNSHWMGAFRGAKPVAVGHSTAAATMKAVEKQMREWGDGARAIMQVQWKQGGGGHVLNVEYHGGRMYYNDAQVNGKYRANELFNALKTGKTQLVRTDNLHFSERAKKSITKDKW